MKIVLIISILFVITLGLQAQTKRIYIHVINEDLESIPAVSIFDRDTVEIAKTNMEGHSSFDLPSNTKELLLGFVGMEWTTIKLKEGCDTVEIVMMNEWIYDFITLKRADRKRLKRFKKLPELHKIAFEKKLFTTPSACYDREFEEYKPRKRKRKNLKTSS